MRKMYSFYMIKNIIKMKTNKKLSIRETVRRFKISLSIVYKWSKKKENQKVWKKQRVNKIYIKELKEYIANNLDIHWYENGKLL